MKPDPEPAEDEEPTILDAGTFLGKALSGEIDPDEWQEI